MISFKDGIILQLMGQELAAANAVACFDAYAARMATGAFPEAQQDLSVIDGFDVLTRASVDADRDYINYVRENTTDEERKLLLSAMDKIATSLIDSDSIPINKGKEGALEVWRHMKNTTKH